MYTDFKNLDPSQQHVLLMSANGYSHLGIFKENGCIQSEIKNLYSEMQKLAKRFYDVSDKLTIQAPKSYNTEPARFIKHVESLIALGHNGHNAVEMAADDYGYSKEAAYNVLRRSNCHKNGLKRHAYAFVTKKLHKKGHSVREIALLLDTSVSNVQRSLKMEII